ncbi:acyl carrier protein [Spirillospora sp. CA-294931]|uniref:acyl carrier protein n=1 Tax=Spirillospora sp. CA-294931 TaxID=3240042 RepID=UPI003D94CCAC
MTVTTGRPDEAEIQEFLAREVALEAERPAHDLIDPDDSFQDLGLDSLGAVNVAKRLEAAFGLRVKAVYFFDFPTIGALSRHLAEQN